MKIRKGDNIKVIAGKDRGKTGKVVRALPDQERVVVEGVNVRKRHVRPKKAGQKGEIVQFSASLHVSNIQIVCGSCGKTTRVGYKVTDTDSTRVCKKCGATI